MRAGIRIDLSSDTQSRPGGDMRQFMSRASVGDDQPREDPTVRELEERVCTLLSMEAALFVPSGTLCNIIAFYLHCRPGDEVFVHRDSHVVYGELGGPAVHSRVVLHLLDGMRGVVEADTLEAALSNPRAYGIRARGRLLSLENTHNYAGGAIVPHGKLRDACAAAHSAGLATHLDGARLLNAAVASGVSASEYCMPFDTAWVDFSKGLGCPAGAVLAGSATFIEEAVQVRRMFGGAMRQAGILAAAGVFALEHNVERLHADHERARWLAEEIQDVPGLQVEPSLVETNIVHITVSEEAPEASQILEQTLSAGVRFGFVDEGTIRAVTHLDVSDTDIRTAKSVLEDAVATADRGPASTAAMGR